MKKARDKYGQILSTGDTVKIITGDSGPNDDICFLKEMREMANSGLDYIIDGIENYPTSAFYIKINTWLFNPRNIIKIIPNELFDKDIRPKGIKPSMFNVEMLVL